MTDRSSWVAWPSCHHGFSPAVRRISRMAAVIATAGVAFGGSPPAASAFGTNLPCRTRSTGAVFSRWLDPAQYFPASNGGFERGSKDWSLNPAAAVVAGNERYQVGRSAGSHSLSLGTGGVAESRTACVTMGEPTVRLFVNTPQALGATLTITTTVRNPTTGVSLTTAYVVAGGVTPTGWAPTPQIVIPNLLGGFLDEELTVRITTGGTPADWGIDDVYVDPYKQR